MRTVSSCEVATKPEATSGLPAGVQEALGELAEPSGPEVGVAGPVQDEVRAAKAPVLAQRLGEPVRARVGVHPGEQNAGDDPAALDRARETALR